MNASPLPIRNCEPVDLDAVPLMDIGGFLATLTNELFAQGRIASYFGFMYKDTIRIVAVVAHHVRGTCSVFSCIAGKEIPSLSHEFPQLQLFEREIAEQFGILFVNHPWFKAVRFHTPLTSAIPLFDKPIGQTDFFSMRGDEIHEVAVGPVHAGVIEPGHFRFQCHGENVYHLEISLGYQYRGIEKLLLDGPHVNTRQLIEAAAGDTTIGHTLAYCQLTEALCGSTVPPRAHALRGIALELERCANHIGDTGALSGDVGYLPTASYCGRIRGDALNATAMLCGSRFGRSFLCSGGVQFDTPENTIHNLLKATNELKADFTNAADLLWNEPSVLARFEDTGIVSYEQCDKMGFVGPAARASGHGEDIRQDFPSGIYQFAHIPISTHTQGDVFARAFVRYSEVLHSLSFITDQCNQLPSGSFSASCNATKKNSLVVSFVEGWRGEICHTAITGENGSFIRYKIVDPSFHNWTALALALRNQQISDFPLCNKSFNLSYCGHDL